MYVLIVHTRICTLLFTCTYTLIHNDSSADQEKKKYVTPEWKLVAPKEGEPQQKEVGGKTYYFCPHFNRGKGMWALHKPSEHKSDWRSQDKGTKPNKEAESTSKSSLKSVSLEIQILNPKKMMVLQLKFISH